MRYGGTGDGTYGGAGRVIASPTFTGTGITGVPYLFSKSFVPVGIGPTGTMGNNGAVTWGTALPNAYTGGAFIFVPAGAIAAGVPAAAAAFYYVGTDTTHGTFFNNALSANLDTNGAPKQVTTPTAFATTGPGAFTGVTAATAALTLTIPAAAMGATGVMEFDFLCANNSTATSKTHTLAFGGTNLVSANASSTTYVRLLGFVANQGVATSQVANVMMLQASAVNGGSGSSYPAANTANSTTLALTLTHGTATDYVGLDGFSAWITR